MQTPETKRNPYHYDYHQLDEFLHRWTDPQELSGILDRSLFDYVRVMSVDHAPADENHYGLLRTLRDHLSNLKK